MNQGWLSDLVRGKIYTIRCMYLGWDSTIVGRYEGRRSMIVRGRQTDLVVFDDPDSPGHKYLLDTAMIKDLS
jgi:hypothetical protein